MDRTIVPLRTLQLGDSVGLYKWPIIALVLLVTGLSLFYSYRQTPIYVSEAGVLVRPIETSDTSESIVNVETERELAQSGAVADIAMKELAASGSDFDPGTLQRDLTVEVVAETEILFFGYSDPDPKTARDRAQAFANAYLTFRRATLKKAAAKRADNLQQEIKVLEDRLTLIDERIDETADPARISRLEGQSTVLLTALLDSQLEKAQLSDIPSVGAIVSPATIPGRPSSPNHVVNGVFGVIIGLGLGIGYAAFRSRRDDRILGQDELETYLEVPVLATVPQVGGLRKRSLLLNDEGAAREMSEAFRILRTNLLAVATPQGARSVVITSAIAGEGKTTTAANLGIVLARSGRRVVLISADLRDQRLSRLFEQPETPGLTDVLWGRAPLDSAVADTDVANLKLLPGGTTPDDPAQLLGSSAMNKVLGALAERCDIVLIDAGPVLGMADTLALAPVADAVLLVVDGRQASFEPLIRACRLLEQAGAHLNGAVSNRGVRRPSILRRIASGLPIARWRAVKV